MRTHLLLTATLFLLAGLACGVAAVAAPFLFAAAADAVAAADAEGAALGAALLGLTGRAAALVAAGLAVPCLLCAWGVFRHRPWARWLAIALGAIALVQVPVGTVGGAYVLWVMLSRRFEPWFEGGGDVSRP